MKRFSKLVSVIVASLMLLVPLAATASASAMLDTFKTLANYGGYDISTPEGIQEMLDDIQNGGLSGIIDMLGGGDILNEIQKYMNSFEKETTTKAPEETTTEEPTTAFVPDVEEEEPVVVPTYPSYQYTPPATLPPQTTVPPETTTFAFIPPEQIYTEAFTTTVFNPIVQENTQSAPSETSPLKTGLGILLLVGSGVVVVVFVVALKKSKI